MNPEIPRISRRDFLRAGLGAFVAGVTFALPRTASADTHGRSADPAPRAADIKTASESLRYGGYELFSDLTPGIGAAVPWVGTGTKWNSLIESLIPTLSAAGIPTVVFAQNSRQEEVNKFREQKGLNASQIQITPCDPTYRIDSNVAIEMETGAVVRAPTMSGFISPWIRDWVPNMVKSADGKFHTLDVAKPGFPNPFTGTGFDIDTLQFGDFRFDGGACFFHPDQNGGLVVSISEAELQGSNGFGEPQGYDIKSAFRKVVAETFGDQTRVVFLPKLADGNVAHIDTFMMPLHDNKILVGEPVSGDKDYEPMQNVADVYRNMGFEIARAPIRRMPNPMQTVTWTNVLPNERNDGTRVLIMPTYKGFENENEEAKDMFKMLGYAVFEVDSTENIKDGGSVHCATNSGITAPILLK